MKRPLERLILDIFVILMIVFLGIVACVIPMTVVMLVSRATRLFMAIATPIGQTNSALKIEFVLTILCVYVVGRLYYSILKLVFSDKSSNKNE